MSWLDAERACWCTRCGSCNWNQVMWDRREVTEILAVELKERSLPVEPMGLCGSSMDEVG